MIDWESEYPQRYRGIYGRAMAGRSRSAGIRAFCLMCMGYSSSEVARCSAHGCPLYPYRLGSGASRDTPNEGLDAQGLIPAEDEEGNEDPECDDDYENESPIMREKARRSVIEEG